MVKTIHLVRHGHHALLEKTLCGRMGAISLDDIGRKQMALCAGLLLPRPSLIQSSPQQRALQSAAILARRFRLAIEVVDAIDEVDLGDWTARSFADLACDESWQLWNEHRGVSRPPNGESIQALQQRVVNHLEALRMDDTYSSVVIVSHAEPIRAALLHYFGMRLNDFASIEVDPASVSTLLADRAGVHVSQVNQKVPA